MANAWFEDDRLDPYELRIAGWLATHVDSYVAERVTRNEIARRTHVSGPKVSAALARLQEIGLIVVEEGDRGRFVIAFDVEMWERPGATLPVDREPRSQSPGATRPVTGSHAPSQPDHTSISVEDQGEDHGDAGSAGVVVVEPEPDYDSFYAAYPKKEGKGEGRVVWQGMTKTDRRAALEGARRHAALVADCPGMYVLPNADRWLRARRWEEDEPRRPPAPKAPPEKHAPGMAAIFRIMAEEQAKGGNIIDTDGREAGPLELRTQT
jgi:hypothetical protein